jgi:hypothetical protein
VRGPFLGDRDANGRRREGGLLHPARHHRQRLAVGAGGGEDEHAAGDAAEGAADREFHFVGDVHHGGASADQL